MQFYARGSKEDFVEFGFVSAMRKRKRAAKKPWLQFCIMLLVFVLLFGLLRWMMATGMGKTELLTALLNFAYYLSILGIVLSAVALLGWGLIYLSYVQAWKKNTCGSYLTIDEKGVLSVKEDGGQQLFFAWPNVEQVIVSENLYMFITSANLGIFINKQAVGGRDMELLQMAAAYMPGKPVLYR